MFHIYLRPIIILIAANGVLLLGFGQRSPATANGDVFNSATINNACYDEFRRSTQPINNQRLAMERQSVLAEAACKTNEGCVSSRQRDRVAQEAVFSERFESAKTQLDNRQTKPRISGSPGTAGGTAMTPQLDPSAAQPPQDPPPDIR
jgi:hypothetical protein